MEKNDYTSVDIRAIFRLDDRYKSIQTLYNAEERGEIPKAERVWGLRLSGTVKSVKP